MPNIIEEDKIVFKAPKFVQYSLILGPVLYLVSIIILFFLGYLGPAPDLVFTLALVTVLIAVPFAYKIIFNPPTITRDGVKGLGFSAHQYSWSEISAVKVCKQNYGGGGNGLAWGAMFYIAGGRHFFVNFPDNEMWPEFIDKVNEFAGCAICSEDQALTDEARKKEKAWGVVGYIIMGIIAVALVYLWFFK